MPTPAIIERNKRHRAHRAGWLRAAVLGANDGLVSTSSLMIGVAAARGGYSAILTAGVAGIAAGAMSMAAGEYVSVSSQTDIEEADAAIEHEHLLADPQGELEELAEIYEGRGLPKELALQVAVHMHKKDALGAHLRDELGQFEHTKARPAQAAMASAATFTLGGMIPLLGIFPKDSSTRVTTIIVITMIGLAIAGAAGARAAGTSYFRPTMRVMLGGTLAMAITAGIGHLAHVAGI